MYLSESSSRLVTTRNILKTGHVKRKLYLFDVNFTCFCKSSLKRSNHLQILEASIAHASDRVLKAYHFQAIVF